MGILQTDIYQNGVILWRGSNSPSFIFPCPPILLLHKSPPHNVDHYYFYQLNMISVEDLLWNPQNNIYWCFLFVDSQSHSSKSTRKLNTFCEAGWFLSFFPSGLKFWFCNLLLVLKPTLCSKASPTMGHRHPKSINQSITHTHSHWWACSMNSKLPFKLNLIFYLHICNTNNLLCSSMYLRCLFHLLLWGRGGERAVNGIDSNTGFLNKTQTLSNSLYPLIVPLYDW